MIQNLKKILHDGSANANRINSLLELSIASYLESNLFQHEKYSNPLKLNRYEFSAFSQNGEDGIIEEIFERIKTTNKFFVEFGVEDGNESNSHYLLYKGWNGIWLEGNEGYVKIINDKFKKFIDKNQLNVLHKFITRENIEDIFKTAGVPKELDLLSIDIDGNDYYVWESIIAYMPRVVVIEYNANFRPGVKFSVDYDANAVWDKSRIFGSSIESLHNLGKEKGYCLVGCCFTGVNAFFVRQDLVQDKFFAPFTTENHYEPQRFFLYNRK